jgi:molybdopterin molybdotransferase
MRPGKPLIFGKMGATPLLGLPGNAVSAMVCGVIFLAPAIRAMLGSADSGPAYPTARLGCDLPENDEREDYLRARLGFDALGPVATPFPKQDSSMFAFMAGADCLVIRPPHAPPIKAGAPVSIIPLGGGNLSI